MALSLLNSLHQFCSTTLSLPKQTPWLSAYEIAFKTSSSMPRATAQTPDATTERRTANYKPSIWGHDFLKTLNSEDYTGEVQVRRANVLKDEMTHLLDNMRYEKEPLPVLELIDDIQRLGLGYVFEEEIRRVLSFLIDNNMKTEGSLHATALCFRLYRQHGFDVSQDIFREFKDSQGSFMEKLSQDVKGILSLFEASYLNIEGEDILDEARAFARAHLSNVNGSVDTSLSELITRALDLPLYRTTTRIEASWYIDAYMRRKNANSSLLELAKLDYNKVQASYQNEVMDLSGWWEKLGLAKNLPFTRDRLVESFLWSVAMADEPQYKYCREGITKIVVLITVIDDVYDVYGTLDEARLFTEAVERWDVNAVESLPYYIKLCFFALYNTVNEFAYNTLKEQGLDILPYLRKKWEGQCKAYLLEAEWFHAGYKPTLEEYLPNACVSITGPMINFHTYVFMAPQITMEALDYLDSYPDLLHWSSLVVRLIDDLGTSTDELNRGDNLKAIQCYMNDEDVTEDVARKHIRHLTDEGWKKMNAEMLANSILPKPYLKEVLNCLRTGEFFYQYGDGHGIPDAETKGRVLSLVVDPIPM